MEIGIILEEYRRRLYGHTPQPDRDNEAELSLKSFLTGKKTPTLGAMSYLFRDPGDDASEIAISLHQFLNGLPNSNFLTGSKFAKRGLQRVINKYRNGGVHDSPIPEDVCRKCVDEVVGTIARPGYIPLVVDWHV